MDALEGSLSRLVRAEESHPRPIKHRQGLFSTHPACSMDPAQGVKPDGVAGAHKRRFIGCRNDKGSDNDLICHSYKLNSSLLTSATCF